MKQAARHVECLQLLAPYLPTYPGLSWESKSCSCCEKSSSLLRHQEVHYRIHKNPPLDHILRLINPVYALHFFHAIFNIIPLLHPVSQVFTSLLVLR
jgi:hypothetical protein